MSINFNDVFSSSQLNINNPKLEELFNKTKDVAEAVGKKSAEHLEISRKRLEILDAKAKLSKAYEKYGKMQYNAYIGEEQDEAVLTATADEIAVIKEKIELLAAEVEEAKAAFTE